MHRTPTRDPSTNKRALPCSALLCCSEIVEAVVRAARKTWQGSPFPRFKVFVCVAARPQLPSVAGTLWRGVVGDVSASYKKGNVKILWAFSSCTSNMDVLQQPQFLGDSGVRTLFCIETSSAKREINVANCAAELVKRAILYNWGRCCWQWRAVTLNLQGVIPRGGRSDSQEHL